MTRPTTEFLNELLTRKGYAVANPRRYPVQVVPHSEAPPAVVECHLRLGPLAEGEAQKRDSGKFLVRVTSFRRRLLDEDNLCEKYHIDCCRYAGLLPGDDPSQARIETRQEKVRSKADERTEIVIERISP